MEHQKLPATQILHQFWVALCKTDLKWTRKRFSIAKSPEIAMYSDCFVQHQGFFFMYLKFDEAYPLFLEQIF